MAKRANPFVEDYVQQSKIHVGLKQFNNNEDRLQKVYGKTGSCILLIRLKSNNHFLYNCIIPFFDYRENTGIFI